MEKEITIIASSETVGKNMKTSGDKCRMIQPEIVDGKLAFNKSPVFDLGAVDITNGKLK